MSAKTDTKTNNFRSLIKIKMFWSRLDIKVQTKKSGSRLTNLSNLKISAFHNSFSQFRSAWIFAFSCQDFSIPQDFSSFLDSKGLDNVKISQQILMPLNKSQQISMCFDKYQQSWCVLTISTKILKRQSLNWKVSILKISTNKKKFLILTWWDNPDT